MPCTYDNPPDHSREFARLLCYVCTCYREGKTFGQALGGNVELEEWWESHKAEDHARLEREANDARVAAAKASALAKLTPEERNLLGFNRESDPSPGGG